MSEPAPIFGWAGRQMASLYARPANRRAFGARDENRNGNFYSGT
jgi:hypothetical protein